MAGHSYGIVVFYGRERGGRLVCRELSALVLGHLHELLDCKVRAGGGPFDGLGDGWSDVRKLEEWRCGWGNGLNEVLRDAEGGE